MTQQEFKDLSDILLDFDIHLDNKIKALEEVFECKWVLWGGDAFLRSATSNHPSDDLYIYVAHSADYPVKHSITNYKGQLLSVDELNAWHKVNVKLKNFK